MDIPQVFEKYFEKDYILLLTKTLYELKNAAYELFLPRGWKLKPELKWDGKDKSLSFSIGGRSDLGYAACKMIGGNLSEYTIYLEGSAIQVKSVVQKTVPLSATEAELNPGVYCYQYMMYALRVL